MNEKLALLGGSKTVTIQLEEKWEPPYGKIKEMIGKQIERGAFSGDWEETYFKFEKEFKDYIGSKYCTALGSGTLSLWAAYYGIGIKPGDEVIVPSYTWISTISPAIYMGAKPVLCDIEEGKLTADLKDIRKRITSKTKAIALVHIYGNVCNMDGIIDIAREYGLYVIEDCSHCHGAEWNGKKAGTIGHVGCFSMQGDFYRGKPVAAGEGGVVITDNADIFGRILMYTHLNRPQNPEDMVSEEYMKFKPANLGGKFRAHPFALSIARVSLESLDYRNELKSRYRQKLFDAFEEIPGIFPIKSYISAKTAGYYGGMHMLYDENFFEGLPRDKFIDALKAEGVVMKHRDYQPMHLSRLFHEGYDIYGTNTGGMAGDYKGYEKGDFPVTESTYAKLMGMPVLTIEPDGYSTQIIEAFRKVASNYKQLL